ncbi:MAG: glutamate ABC transporter substrate-binding protein [Atopobiaceae bacterium]|nr:glutamate ABC transporter substrate-binding protein [Atopobiaceae bacterium]
MSLFEKSVTRRQALGLAGASFAFFGLAGCGSSSDSSSSASSGSASGSESSSSSSSTDLDTSAYDALVAGGSTASDDVISASSWASKVKEAGTLRVGGTQTSTLFSLMNEVDNKLRGFDAGLYQLLTHYILGDESKYELTQVTSDTRESVLQNDQVDTVFATYSITDDRKKVISFAGPYYNSQQGILVLVDNTDINSVDDLAGKTVAAQSGSTGPSLLEQYAPDATVQEFSTDEEARQALEQKRVDAYVIDATIQMGSVVKNPGKYRLVEQTFGPDDKYGIGLPLSSDGVDFVNSWLKAVEDDGTWAKLWQITIGDRIDQDSAPEPPAIGA